VQQEHADLIVTGRIVTMDAQRRVLDDGAVAVKNGAIVAMGTADDIAKRYTAARMLGGPAAIVLPGFIEGHTHCTQCFVRSLTSNELPMIPRIYSPAQRSLDAEQAGITVAVEPVAASAFAVKAARPLNSELCSDRFAAAFGLRVANWREDLRRCLSGQAAVVENPQR